jgi:hypothetical protein
VAVFFADCDTPAAVYALFVDRSGDSSSAFGDASRRCSNRDGFANHRTDFSIWPRGRCGHKRCGKKENKNTPSGSGGRAWSWSRLSYAQRRPSSRMRARASSWRREDGLFMARIFSTPEKRMQAFSGERVRILAFGTRNIDAQKRRETSLLPPKFPLPLVFQPLLCIPA